MNNFGPLRWMLAFALLAAGVMAADGAKGILPEDATPDQILDAFNSQSGSWKDYTFTMTTKVRRGEKSEESTLSFSSKPPNYFKTKVIGGKDDGSVVGRGRSGAIRAHGGGLLGVITITMKEDDPRLADMRGARIQDAGWEFMIGQFARRRELGWTFERLPDEKIRGTECFVVQASGKPDKMGETREVFCFAKRDMTVRARRLWETDVLVDDTVYYDVKLNQNLADEFFDL